VAILRRHLIDRTSIADLCDEYKIYPTMFYQWQAQFFENGSAAIARKTNSSSTQHQKQSNNFEASLQLKTSFLGTYEKATGTS
jgi:transposase